MKLDTIDKAILNRIQSDFPIESRPYGAIAQELGLTEQQVLQRVQTLKAEGIIRRIGGNFVPHKVGFVSTLCAAKVPEDQIDAFAAVVNKYTGVTHNYQRDNAFNIWFTFIPSGPSPSIPTAAASPAPPPAEPAVLVLGSPPSVPPALLPTSSPEDAWPSVVVPQPCVASAPSAEKNNRHETLAPVGGFEASMVSSVPLQAMAGRTAEQNRRR